MPAAPCFRGVAFLTATLLLAHSAGGYGNLFAAEDQAPLGDRPPVKTGFIPELALDNDPVVAWRFTSTTEQGNRPLGLCDPATSGGMLFFGDDLGVVRAVTAREGVPIWKHEHGERVYFPPTCDDDRLFFTTRKGITALASASGLHLWHRPVTHSVGRCVTWKDSDTVYFSDSDGWTYALDSATGLEKWKSSFMADTPKDPPGFDGNRARFQGTAARPTGIATDGKLVYQSVFDQCRVVAFDCTTGEKQASFQTAGWILADPAIDQQRLYVGSQDEHLYCFDRSSGKTLWKYRTKSRIESGVGVVGDFAIVGSCDGTIHCCSRMSGALQWEFATENPGAIYSAPIVTKNSVYFAAAEGTVYALAIETGQLLWKIRPSATSHLYSSMATDGTRIFVKSRPKDNNIGESSIIAIGPATEQ